MPFQDNYDLMEGWLAIICTFYCIIVYFSLAKYNWSAKERISLTQINFNDIINEQFELSRVISKNRKILFIWYEYKKITT